MRAYISYLLNNGCSMWIGPIRLPKTRTRSPRELMTFHSKHLNEWPGPCGTSESMKSNFSNQNPGSHALR